MPKPRVLPVPVLAWPITSLPESATGRVISWTGKASTMPSASSASAVSESTPSSRKVVRGPASSVWWGPSVPKAGRDRGALEKAGRGTGPLAFGRPPERVGRSQSSSDRASAFTTTVPGGVRPVG
ncbi:hypothetical protein B4N89_10070 [Embleya scabrispora]|uniref:Uncharacterized protein n=1 Tax=Embleya scabrispora TaxID=159449 RepID=A0A1T3NWM0_9ACTN|nr:hypothetical protein B4N89_10070 [Embleya scabrispora]